ncbi:hypothetical protein V9T40_011039 [Parthenolecanium corni]|uniref:MATH domain-containing protein n=1 Tax=Parthenolecanium corni TaxID=536013 RepID=A0AAN9T4R7_9HEMI
MWGYAEFMEWERVVDPNNGFVKDNILKIQVVHFFLDAGKWKLTEVDDMIVAVKEADTKENISDDDDEASYSSSSSESSQSSSTDGEKSQQNDQNKKFLRIIESSLSFL